MAVQRNSKFDHVVAVQWWLQNKGYSDIIADPIEYVSYRHVPTQIGELPYEVSTSYFVCLWFRLQETGVGVRKGEERASGVGMMGLAGEPSGLGMPRGAVHSVPPLLGHPL